MDTSTDSILLITKRRVPAQLFRLPLHPATSGVLIAQLRGTLAGIPQPKPDALKAAPRIARYLSEVTAADIAPDRSSIAVLTYRSAYFCIGAAPRRAGRRGWRGRRARCRSAGCRRPKHWRSGSMDAVFTSVASICRRRSCRSQFLHPIDSIVNIIKIGMEPLMFVAI